MKTGHRLSIKDYSLRELLPLSLTSTPAVSIRQENKIWEASAMLVHYLESFTDSLVVTDNKNQPIGVIGGFEIIKNVFENPSSELFDEKTVKDIMDVELLQITPNITLEELLESWKNTRRAFCILPNQYGGYSAISARKILEIGAKCKTTITISDLPKKKLATFSSNDSVGHIINSMLKNKTRKLVHENTNDFISDRIIIQTIAKDLDYLKKTQNFLDIKIHPSFQLAEIKRIREELNLSDLARLMFGMMHPYVMNKNQVYTPWDVCLGLLINDIELQQI